MPVSNVSVPKTKLVYSCASASGCCRKCKGQAPGTGPGQVCGSYYYLCDLDASHLGQVSPYWLGGKSQPCPGMWAFKSESVHIAVQSWACDLTSLSQSPQLEW